MHGELAIMIITELPDIKWIMMMLYFGAVKQIVVLSAVADVCVIR